MLPVVIAILCLVAAVAAASGHFMGRRSRLLANCRLALDTRDEALKARQDLARERIEQGPMQGRLQRQVRKSHRAERHTCPGSAL